MKVLSRAFILFHVLQILCNVKAIDNNNLCILKEHGDFQPHPLDCYKFFRCVYQRAYEFKCPSKLMWNQKKKTCDFAYNTICLSSADENATQSPVKSKSSAYPETLSVKFKQQSNPIETSTEYADESVVTKKKLVSKLITTLYAEKLSTSDCTETSAKTSHYEFPQKILKQTLDLGEEESTTPEISLLDGVLTISDSYQYKSEAATSKLAGNTISSTESPTNTKMEISVTEINLVQTLTKVADSRTGASNKTIDFTEINTMEVIELTATEANVVIIDLSPDTGESDTVTISTVNEILSTVNEYGTITVLEINPKKENETIDVFDLQIQANAVTTGNSDNAYTIENINTFTEPYIFGTIADDLYTNEEVDNNLSEIFKEIARKDFEKMQTTTEIPVLENNEHDLFDVLVISKQYSAEVFQKTTKANVIEKDAALSSNEKNSSFAENLSSDFYDNKDIEATSMVHPDSTESYLTLHTTTVDPRLPHRAAKCRGTDNRVQFTAKNCHQYYQCFAGWAFLLNCQANYYFDESVGHCIENMNEICTDWQNML